MHQGSLAAHTVKIFLGHPSRFLVALSNARGLTGGRALVGASDTDTWLNEVINLVKKVVIALTASSEYYGILWNCLCRQKGLCCGV